MKIAVLAVGTPAEVQRAMALADELARREQLRVWTCARAASTLTESAKDLELRTWQHEAEPPSSAPSSHARTEPPAVVLRVLEQVELLTLELIAPGSVFRAALAASCSRADTDADQDLRRHPQSTRAQPAPTTSEVLQLSPDGAWFCWRGRHVDLSARRVLTRLLETLVRARCERPGCSVKLEELLSAAWPNEQMQRKSAENRVRVALSTLRSLGLRELLISRPGGLMLDPAVDVLCTVSVAPR